MPARPLPFVMGELAMARIVHIAIKVDDLEKSTKFYEDVFGIYQTKTGHARGHTSRHMTDGNIDFAIMTYDSEDEAEAKLIGKGPGIHHYGVEVEDREGTMKKIPSKIVHLALKVEDLEKATKFYENVFGFKTVSTEKSRKHTSRHMTDGS